MSGRGKPGDVGGNVPEPRETADASEEQESVEQARKRRRRATSATTLNEWPAVELTPPARPSRPALPLPDSDESGEPPRPEGKRGHRRKLPLPSGGDPPQGRESRPPPGPRSPVPRAPSSHLRQGPFVRERTPLPGLPGEGPTSAGSDPGLDDAWTSDVDEWTGAPTRKRAPSAAPDRAAADSSPAGDPGIDDGIDIGLLDSGSQTAPPEPGLAEPVLVEELRDVPPEAQGPGDDAPTTEFRIAYLDEVDSDEPGAQAPPAGATPEGSEPAAPRARASTADLELDLDEVFDALSWEDEAVEFTDAESYSSVLLASLDRDAPAGESASERLRRRVSMLIERAQAEYIQGSYEAAITALELAWNEDPDSVMVHKVTQQHHDTICEIYEAFMGDTGAVLSLAVPLHEIRPDSLNSRTAFLLTRIDGMMTVEDLLDVAGMPRLEALRYLCNLLVRGILQRG